MDDLVGAIFDAGGDWITPTFALLTPGDDLHITNAPGYTGISVLALLMKNGIFCWCPQITDEGVLVKVGDLKKAIAFLKKKGITAY